MRKFLSFSLLLLLFLLLLVVIVVFVVAAASAVLAANETEIPVVVADTTTAAPTPAPPPPHMPFVPFFSRPVAADETPSSSVTNNPSGIAADTCTTSGASGPDIDALVQKFKSSERTVCSITNNKDLAAKIVEYTADFAGTKLSVQQYVRVRSSGLFDTLEDIKCEQEQQQQHADNNNNNNNNGHPSVGGVYLTNSKGEFVTPEWLHHHHDKQHAEGAGGEGGGGDTDPTTTTAAQSTRPEAEIAAATAAGGVASSNYTYPPFDMWVHAPGNRERRTVIRVDRVEPGNVLSNFEIAFNLFLVTNLFKGTTTASEFRLVFRDRASLYWGDKAVLQRLVKDSENDMIFFDRQKQKPKPQEKKLDGGEDATTRAPRKKKRRHKKGHHEDATAEMATTAGADDMPPDTPSPPDPAADVVEFANLIEFGGFPFTAVVESNNQQTDNNNKNDRGAVIAATGGSKSSLSSSSSSPSPISCPSALLQSFTHWYAMEVGVAAGAAAASSLRDGASSKLRVLWCSRQPQKGLMKRQEMYLPSRRLQDEMQFLIDLADELGSGVQLRSLDFGERGDVALSIGSVRDTDVFIGAHGAGLAWGMFLRPAETALVEVFTEDLGETLQEVSPYKRIAGLTGVAYASTRIKGGYEEPPFELPMSGEQREIAWTADDVKRIASTVLSLPFSRPLPETKEWCK